MRRLLPTILFLLAGLPLFGVTGYDEPAWVYRGRGDRYYREGEMGRAISEYKKAIIRREREGEGTESYPEVHLMLARIYLEQGLPELALQHVMIAENTKESLEIGDQVYDILYTKAKIFFMLDRIRDMEAVYTGIIGEDDNFEYYERQKLSSLSDEFIRELRAMADLRAKFGHAYYALGVLKYRNNSYDAAEPYLKMAFLYAYDANTARFLIDCYDKMGHRTESERVRQIVGE
jgi:tetratricopeptide (TPR) repeat protein